MKKNSQRAQPKGQTIDSIDQFSKKMNKNKMFYDKFNSILIKEFDQILKEEINVCICCGEECVGKSIGPHYKNSKKCANFKRQKEGKGDEYDHEYERTPLNVKDTNTKRKGNDQMEKEPNKITPQEGYDELNEYFDSF